MLANAKKLQLDPELAVFWAGFLKRIRRLGWQPSWRSGIAKHKTSLTVPVRGREKDITFAFINKDRREWYDETNAFLSAIEDVKSEICRKKKSAVEA